MGLLKYLNNKAGSVGPDVHFHRASVDGFPFRGRPPMVKSDEVDDRFIHVADAKNGTFYTGDVEQNGNYLTVMDRIVNGWFRLLFIDRWRNEGDNHHYVYIEWVENYFEDGNPNAGSL